MKNLHFLHRPGRYPVGNRQRVYPAGQNSLYGAAGCQRPQGWQPSGLQMYQILLGRSGLGELPLLPRRWIIIFMNSKFRGLRCVYGLGWTIQRRLIGGSLQYDAPNSSILSSVRSAEHKL